METGCVVCKYIEGRLIRGMLPVTKVGTQKDIKMPDLCLDLRDNCPHTTQFISSITIPEGVKIRIARVGNRDWSAFSGYAHIPTIPGSRYTLMLESSIAS